MLDRNKDIIYNKEYLVVVPKIDELYIEGFSYSFKNTIVMENDVEEINKITNFINNNNFKKLIFVDYKVEYEEIINNLNDNHDISMIFTKSLGALSDAYILYLFNNLFRMYKEKIVNKIGFLDKGFYDTFKSKGENVEHVILDLPKNENNNKEYDKNLIGILNSEHNPRHSFYNELSAVKLSNKYIAKLNNPIKITKKFLSLFNIKSIKSNNEGLFKDNNINLYINFTDNDNLLFIKSMDNNIPCILGNNSIIEDNKILKELLMVKSDDDINEINEKIEMASKNRTKILNEYNSFRKEYSNNSKKSIESFLGCYVEEEKVDDNELLLSIIVPVYNTEKYLENSLQSIINATPDNSEVIVINDGSTDNSEKIIKKFAKKYKDTIKYIKQENHGLGNVRNVGLKEAKGKYIASVDSDDTINIDFFNEAIEYLNSNIDIVIYDWLSVTNETSYDTPAIETVFNNISKYKGLLYTTIMPSTCNKIIKRSLFEELNLKYIEDRFEDLSANPFVLLKAKTIKYINKSYYEYYIRSDSIMRSAAGYSMIDVIKLVDERIKKYKQYINVDLDEFKYYTYSWRIEEYILNQLYTIQEKELSEFIEYINDNLKSIILNIFENGKYNEMLETLEEKDRNYIVERNKAFKDNKLEKFIKQARKNNNYFKITPVIIYYGYKK